MDSNLSDTDPISQRLSNLLVDAFYLDAPTADLDLIETGILDSHQVVELLLKLEREFGLSIALEDIELDNLRTLERIARFVAKQTAEKATRALPAGASG